MDWTGPVNGLLAGTFFLEFDVPDFNKEMPQNAKTTDGYQFTLSVQPLAVPEPSALMLCGMGSFVLLSCWWCRKGGLWG